MHWLPTSERPGPALMSATTARSLSLCASTHPCQGSGLAASLAPRPWHEPTFQHPDRASSSQGCADSPPALLRLASHVARSSQGTGSLGGSSFVGPLLQDTIASTTRREPIHAATSDQAATSTAGTGSKATPGKALVGSYAFSDFKMP